MPRRNYMKMTPEELALIIISEPKPMGEDEHRWSHDKQQCKVELCNRMYAEAKRKFVSFAKKKGAIANDLGIPGEVDLSGDYFYKAFEKSLEYFAQNYDRYSFVKTFRMKYGHFLNDDFAARSREKNPEDSDKRLAEIRNAVKLLIKKAREAGKIDMDEDGLKKRWKNISFLKRESVHAFLSDCLHMTQEEIFRFDEHVFDQHYTASLDKDSEGEKTSAQSKILEDASKHQQENLDDEDHQDTILHVVDRVLEITYKEAQQRKRKAPERMSGFWTIRFIQNKFQDDFAERKAKYIFIVFYRKYRSLCEKEEDKKLQNLMAVKLQIASDTWRKCFTQIYNYVWMVIDKQHLYRKG